MPVTGMTPYYFLAIFLVSLVSCGTKSDFKVKSPCAITRHIKSNNPIIRIVDEVNDEPGVILGQEGLQYYTLISSRIRREVVIECSSSNAQVKWIYKGVGAFSGLKTVSTRWTPGNDITRAPNCFSTALVISHVTDQLTGEYKCQEVNGTTSSKKKGPRKNSFKLFVPSVSPEYPKEGSEVNVTVSNGQEKLQRPYVVLPCISKRTGENVTLYRTSSNGLEPVSYRNMNYDPFVGFMVPQSSLKFEGSRVLPLECRWNKTNETLLKVNLIMESEEKIAPEKELVKSSSPYFSWTTKSNPQLRFTPDIKANVLVWQQFFTKKGYEEISRDAPMFYLGSASLMNLTHGEKGEFALMEGDGEGIIHKWNYSILDAEAEQNAGLKYDDYEIFHVFICRSASEEKPTITLKSIEENKNVTGAYNISDCPDEREYRGIGCVMLTSYVHQGEVKCIGDGVYETIRYPPQPFEAGRPFFLERGKMLELTLPPDADKIKIPCLTNSEASTSFFLYKKVNDGYKKIWSEDDEEFTDSDIEFYPTSGFHLSQTNSGETHDLTGEYLCSSSFDPNDMSDAVRVVVRKEIGTNFKVVPKENQVFGRIPVKLSWEADEELQIISTNGVPLRNISLGRDDATDPMYGFGGKVVIMEGTPEGQSRSLSLRRKMDGAVLHEWTFTQIDRDGDHRASLQVDVKEDEKGDRVIVAVCRGKTSQRPRIRYYHCQNEESCDLMRRCHQRDCFNPSFPSEDATVIGIVDNCDAQKGCNAIAIRSVFLNGILNISCSGEGVDEFRVLTDVFFKDYITWDAENQEDGYIHLNTAFAVHAADQNPQREIQHIGANVEWELGETVEFNCVAAPFKYSNGIKWAVETKQGKMIYQKDSIFDVQFKYIGSTQVASTFSLLIDSMDYSRVYCFVPKLGSPTEWSNASMPIFIRPESSDDYCHDTHSIHLINIYPSPSKLNLELNETKLNQLPYFVVPENVLQFAVKISGPKPFTWTFNGAGDGPSRTPLIQSDRQILDFFDSSTYCFSSRLLLNLRHKNPNDTGRFIVKHKYESQELASFYIFIPSQHPPYLLQSGSRINVTLPEDSNSIFIPCLVNNPNVKVELLSIKSEGKTHPVEAAYDPTRGFKLENITSAGGTYKCVANGNESDSVVVFVSPPIRIPELKYEKVNDFHVFTCKSGNAEPPNMTLTEMADDGTPVENSTEYKMTRCAGGCMALITQVNQGSVSCVGEGIDENYRFPPNINANQRNSDKTVGLWFDNSTNSFKCQMNTEEPPQLAAVTCRRPNECEIMKRLLQGRGDLSQATYSTCGEGCAELQVRTREMSYTSPNWFSIFLRCKGEDNMEILSQYFYDKERMTYASMQNAEQLKRIRVDVPGLRKHGRNLIATFRCFANRYFYSRGIQWGLEGKNGILEFPPTAASQVEVQSFSAVMSSISLEIDESVHTAVYCFVPLLDSPAWANATVKLPIEQLMINI